MRVDANGTEARTHLRRQSSLRVVMYSHDTMGLGHMRRNLLLAQMLAGAPHDATVLLIAGAAEIGGFRLPQGVDALALPALHKCGRSYRPRRLGVSLEELTDVRREAIQATVRAFQPDVFIADNIPGGAQRELLPTLRMLGESPTVRCVLGLRDILDEEQAVRTEWSEADAVETVRQFYDAIWIYGEQSFFDLVDAYDWPSDVAARITYAGFLDQSPRLEVARQEPPLDALSRPYAACVVGGGQDGFALADNFLKADLPNDWAGVVVTGPCMDGQQVRRLRDLAGSRPNRVVYEFPLEADAIISGAQRVVGMGGYNTLCAILSYQTPALIVPRVQPRQEQWMRAVRLRQRGLVGVLHPDDLSARALTEWLGSDVDEVKDARAVLDFAGLERIPSFLTDVVERPRQANTQTPAWAIGNATS